MGCNSSKSLAFVEADDSIHRMIVHDQKKLATSVVAYRPRLEHPLLRDGAGVIGDTVCLEEDGVLDESTKEETDRLLFHSINHNDIVDPRDEELAASA
eukprot:CAMPEP_0168740528 /NCGR_PEP_ID=MMETSP0724-20121128/12034_1 /TAXON_ID=265536 /ORGANISM="Amphiprora sp., Strain CCMP467" /LENGTH=97 /DNA_ID=CAMNT_0008787983 /DNA_START=119 /DNA_END=412 /DNA_ORIENTATION=-